MSSTLYRKYRPKNLSEVIGQRHIIQTLSNAVKNNRLGHAYLFTGPRGTGKTSVARILAKTINCENLKNSIACEKCPACQSIAAGRSLDIIEIDAASNTGVDNIRELRETVALPPSALKYKVYIIDEAHMLSAGAFNALLKTLEEPPKHVVFILATTEIHKVPETILSRCQRFDFARFPIQNIIEKLTLIAQAEKIKIDQASLEMIAIAAEGGMRDAESLLEQVIALEDKNITAREVEEILGTADRSFAHQLADMLIAEDSRSAIEKINFLLNDGYDLKVFNKSFINYLRQLMLVKINPELKSAFAYEMTIEDAAKIIEQAKKISLEKILAALHLFSDAQEKISASILPQLPLEIAVIKTTHTLPSMAMAMAMAKPIDYKLQSSDNSDADHHIQKSPKSQAPNLKQIQNPNNQDSKKSDSVTANDASSEQSGNLTLDAVRNNWNKLLEEITPYNHSLKALLTNCQAFRAEGNLITLSTPYDFYKEKLNEQTNRLTVEKVFGKILGLKIRIKVLTDKGNGVNSPSPKYTTRPSDIADEPAKEQSSLLASALEIMGGKVVEE